MKLSFYLVALLIVMTVALVSCQRQAVSDEQPLVSPSSSSTPEPSRLQACELVSKPVMEKLVDAPLLEPQQSTIYSNGTYLSQGCLYLAADNAYVPTVQIDLESPINESLVPQWHAQQASDAASARYRLLELPPPVTAGYYSDRGLEMLVNGYAVTVAVSMPAASANQSTAEIIAKQILSIWTATPSAQRQ